MDVKGNPDLITYRMVFGMDEAYERKPSEGLH